MFKLSPDGTRLLYLWPFLWQRLDEHEQQCRLYVFESVHKRGRYLSRELVCFFEADEGLPQQSAIESAVGDLRLEIDGAFCDCSYVVNRDQGVAQVVQNAPKKHDVELFAECGGQVVDILLYVLDVRAKEVLQTIEAEVVDRHRVHRHDSVRSPPLGEERRATVGRADVEDARADEIADTRALEQPLDVVQSGRQHVVG